MAGNRGQYTAEYHLSAKLLSFISFFLLLSSTISSQESTTSYNFLRLPVSAHVAAVGGDNITLTDDDAALIFHNPALINGVSDKSINLNFMTFMEGAKTASAAFMKGAVNRGTWGVTAQYMDYGEMKETTPEGEQLGTFSARDIAVGGTFAYALTNQLNGGVTAKFITSYIGDYNSIAMGVDLGLNYYDPDREWSISAVAKNLGGQLKAYDDNYEKMPIDVQVGVSKRLVGSPFRLSATFVDLNHWDYKFINHLVAGVDIILSPQIYFAAGYNFRRADEMSIIATDEEKGSSHMAGLSLGAGLMLDRFKLSLAYAKYHVSSSSLMVNVSFSL